MKKMSSVKITSSPNSDRPQFGLWTEACDHWQVTGHVVTGRIREDFLLLYCVGGSGTYRAGQRSFRISPGDIFAVHPGIEHGYRCDAQGWDIWFVHFNGDQATRLIDWIGFTISQPIIRIGISKKFIASFNKLCKASKNQKIHYDIDTFVLLYELLGTLKKTIRQRSVSSDAITQSVNGDCQSVEQMAERAGFSKFHFIRKFQTVVGQTPWQYINYRKIAQAKQLLCERDLSIQQIAVRLDFEDANYFSRFFRKAVGITATQYRKNMSM